MNEEIDKSLAAVIDPEAMGERVFEPIRLEQAQEVLVWMRGKFKEGYVMYAHDLNAPILEQVRGENGEMAFATGLIVQPMRDRKVKVEEKDAPAIG